jgi:hypothetical protein
MQPPAASSSESSVPRSWEAVAELLTRHGFIELGDEAGDETASEGEPPGLSPV